MWQDGDHLRKIAFRCIVNSSDGEMIGGVILQAGDGKTGFFADTDRGGGLLGPGSIKWGACLASLLIIEFIAGHRFRVGRPAKGIVLGAGKSGCA